MADIFLSYTEKDRDTVRRLAELLQSAGWSVWWDRRIPAGLTWRNVLERELQQMRCMLVLWSRHSVVSDWVCEEAAEARQLGRLVPVLIERVRQPAGFREIQAADLIGWDGSREFAGAQQLVEDIRRLMNETAAPTGAAPASSPPLAPADADRPAQPSPAPTGQSALWGVAAVLVLIATGAYFAAASRNKTPETRAEPIAAPAKAPARVASSGALPADGPASQAARDGVPPAAAPTARAGVAAASAAASSASRAAVDTQARAASKPALSASSIASRCAALKDRMVLGESVSAQSQAFYLQECRK